MGYGTLAEVYHAGVPFGYIARERFRESKTLVSYINEKMKGFEIDEKAFYQGNWIPKLPELQAMPRLIRNTPNGATQIAHFIDNLLEKQKGRFISKATF